MQAHRLSLLIQAGIYLRTVPKEAVKEHEWSSGYGPQGLINENRQLAFPRFQIRIHSLRDSPVSVAIARQSHHQAK